MSLNSVVILLVAASATVAALFIDEVGQRDWHLKLIGHVDSALVSENSVFAVGSRGHVAAIAQSGELLWRLPVFTPDKGSVVTFLLPSRKVPNIGIVTSERIIYFVSPSNGDVVTTSTLGSPNTLRRLVGCNVDDGSTVMCLEVTEDQLPVLSTYNTAVSERGDDDYSTKVSVTPVNLPDGETLVDAQVNRHCAWLLTNNKRVYQVDMRAGSARKIEEGVKRIVSSTPTLVVLDYDSIDKELSVFSEGVSVFSLSSAEIQGVTNIVATNNGHVVFLRYLVDGRIELVVVSAKGTHEVIVTLPSHTAHPILLSSRVDNGVITAVIRASNDDIFAVRANFLQSESAIVIWTRYEGLASPADAILVNSDKDSFGFDGTLYVVSVFGTVYSRQVTAEGRFGVLGNFDLSNDRKASFSQLGVRGGEIFVTAQTATETLRLSLTRVGVPIWTTNLALVTAEDWAITSDHTLVGTPPAETYFSWHANFSIGALDGFFVDGDRSVKSRWVVRLGSPIAAVATLGRQGAHESNENLRHVHNASGVGTVHHKYRTRHLIVVVQEIENSARLTAIDSITGSVVASQQMIGVKAGSSRLIVTEHTVVVPYVATADGRPYVLVWEMFNSEERIVTDAMSVTPAGIVSSLFSSWKEKPKASAFTTRIPTVVAFRRPLLVGQVTAVGVTTSTLGAARRFVLFSTTRGHIYAVELSSMLIDSPGIVNPLVPTDPPIDAVGAPATSIISHQYDVLGVRRILSFPTRLESSCHVVAMGLDVFYARVAAGKPFDMLNVDFNTVLVWEITVGCIVLMVVLSFFAQKKRLSRAWA